MCGIAGMIDMAGRRAVPPETIRAMARALTHRGPDEEGIFIVPARLWPHGD